MPLPDAPPTDQSRVYREFASKTALPGASGAITADLIDNFKNSLFIDEFSEDELRRLVLLQMATGAGSISGPLADSGQIITSGTMTGTAVTVTLKEPGIGEVWQLCEAECKGTLGDTPRFRLYVEDSAGTICELGDTTLSVSSTERFDGEKSYGPVYFDSNTPLKCQLINGSSTSGSVECLIFRVR